MELLHTGFVKKESETVKTKRKFTENALVLAIAAYALILFGQVIYMPFEELPFLSNLFSGLGFSSAAVETIILYAPFIGIWATVLLWYAVRKNNRTLFKSLTGFVKGNNVKKCLLGAAIGFGMNAFCALCAWLHGDIQLTFVNFSLMPALTIMLFVLIQSSGEELICRSYLYQKLMKSYKTPIMAIGFNAVFFGLIHIFNPGMQPLAMINVTLSGILFGMMVYCFDSFWCAAFAHMAWNFTQNILFGLPNSGNLVPYSIFTLNAGAKSSLFYDPGFGIEGTIIAVLVQLAVIVGIYVWYKKHPKQPTDIWAE